MSRQPYEVIAEIIHSSTGRLDEINILLKTSNGSPLYPQMILDAVSDLLLFEYGVSYERSEGEFDA